MLQYGAAHIQWTVTAFRGAHGGPVTDGIRPFFFSWCGWSTGENSFLGLITVFASQVLTVVFLLLFTPCGRSTSSLRSMISGPGGLVGQHCRGREREVCDVMASDVNGSM